MQQHPPKFPSRRSPAHFAPHEVGNRPTIIFLTVCTWHRRSLLARHDVVAVLRRAWQTAEHWRVGRWLAMPDHLHLFCAPATHPPERLRGWVKYWKSEVSRHWPCRRRQHPIWQRDGWDVQLRRGESYSQKWQYIRENPVRAGLVDSPDEWPFQGEEHVLYWIE